MYASPSAAAPSLRRPCAAPAPSVGARRLSRVSRNAPSFAAARPSIAAATTSTAVRPPARPAQKISTDGVQDVPLITIPDRYAELCCSPARRRRGRLCRWKLESDGRGSSVGQTFGEEKERARGRARAGRSTASAPRLCRQSTPTADRRRPSFLPSVLSEASVKASPTDQDGDRGW